jgi:hypothetical protein
MHTDGGIKYNFMITKLKFVLKIFLSLLINFLSWLITLSLAVMFEGNSYGYIGYIMITIVIVLTLIPLFVVYKFKPLKNKSSNIVYWGISILGILTHFWFYFIFVIGPFWTW